MKKSPKDPREKWQAHRGPVGQGKWQMPYSRQQFYGLLMRLGTLWYRLDQARLYWPPLMGALKTIEGGLTRRLSAMEASLQYARPKTKAREVAGFHEAFYTLLREIKQWEPSMQWSQAHLEIRVHQQGTCSICGVDLKWPAFITYGKGQQSKEVGVHCLESLIRKMEAFLQMLQAEVGTVQQQQTESLGPHRLLQ